MGIYEKNLKTLAVYYPELDKIIKKAQIETESELEIIEENSYEGDKILKIKKDDKICYLNGKRNSSEAASIWVETLGKLPRNTPVLLMGIGNFSYLKELVEKTKNRITIVVYEPSLEIFIKFLEMVDIQKWMEKHLIIFWVNGLEEMTGEHARAMLKQVLTYEMLEYFKYFILPNYETLFKEEIVEFTKICRDVAMGGLVRFNTDNVFSTVMLKNLFSNARYLCQGYHISQLVEVIPRNIPGIVVAAGPSLNKNVQELKRAKGKAFILAVDTAIKPLLQAGIVPDMFAVIDGMKPLELVQKEDVREIPLFTTLNAAPEILDYQTGMKFFSNEGYQFAERILRKSGCKPALVASGGSVATNAFSLLYKIGIDTIILVGQDLAYTNNKSHADGTFHDEMEEEDTSSFIMVEGNIEEKVPTRTNLKMFLDWYVGAIKEARKHSAKFRVINATEGGARIQGAEIMTLREAIDQECSKEVDIGVCLKKLSPMLNTEMREWAVDYLRSLSEEFLKLGKDARILKELYKKLDKICDKRNIDTKEYMSIMKSLERKVKDIETKEVYQLVEITMNNAKIILRNEQFLTEDSIQKEGKEIARKGILYIENVMKLAKAFKEYAQDIFTNETFANICINDEE